MTTAVEFCPRASANQWLDLRKMKRGGEVENTEKRGGEKKKIPETVNPRSRTLNARGGGRRGREYGGEEEEEEEEEEAVVHAHKT